MWSRILKTYPDASINNIWKSLIEMTNMFHEIGLDVANKLGLNYNKFEAENVKKYIQNMEKRIKK